ncbi:LysR family transcriptional regulator [Novosphingobium sediminicola]|uniref:LysR family nod box-dependent transcriptional activator n=1 Tax=Novosphingobium sediminicola TaxID=563162 RepID=A0A7W6CJH0_9SPHN|nr:LysR family transcriptional regulator [Novosphingobium sediminicola]MBB3955583.1 LysR family nod box-dependent transcriptional activator [Novosphingobium sediminicola]
MRFLDLDLNLLVALDILLKERSVTVAADRLCLTQSAISNSLKRLRLYFGDELLVMQGRQLVLTPRAEELVNPVRALFATITATITAKPRFDPVTADRQICVMASDYAAHVLLAPVLRRLETLAPLLRIAILPMADAPHEALERGHIDLLLTLESALSPDHPSQFLFADDHVILGWAGNGAMREEMDAALFFSLGHVVCRFGRGGVPTFDEPYLGRIRKRRVEMVAPSFVEQASLIAGSRRIAVTYRHLAEQLSRFMPLVIRELPFAIPPIREAVQWRISNNDDEAIRWLVGVIAETAGGLRG